MSSTSCGFDGHKALLICKLHRVEVAPPLHFHRHGGCWSFCRVKNLFWVFYSSFSKFWSRHNCIYLMVERLVPVDLLLQFSHHQWYCLQMVPQFISPDYQSTYWFITSGETCCFLMLLANLSVSVGWRFKKPSTHSLPERLFLKGFIVVCQGFTKFSLRPFSQTNLTENRTLNKLSHN